MIILKVNRHLNRRLSEMIKVFSSFCSNPVFVCAWDLFFKMYCSLRLNRKQTKQKQKEKNFLFVFSSFKLVHLCLLLFRFFFWHIYKKKTLDSGSRFFLFFLVCIARRVLKEFFICLSVIFFVVAVYRKISLYKEKKKKKNKNHTHSFDI